MSDRCSCGVLVALIARVDLRAHESACGLVVSGPIAKPVRRARTLEQERKRRYYWRHRERLLGENRARGWGNRRRDERRSEERFRRDGCRTVWSVEPE